MRGAGRRSSLAVLATIVILALTVTLVAVSRSHTGGRDPKSPRLRPVAGDVRRARKLLLTKVQLPSGFHTFNSGAATKRYAGPCGKKLEPNLSALTETAEVYGFGLAHGYTGVQYVSLVRVFISAAEALQAQTLLTSSEEDECVVEIARARLKGLPAKILAQSLTQLSRIENGAIVRARRAILRVRVGNVLFQDEASLIVLRRGRTLCELLTSGSWESRTRKTWADAISVVSHNLGRSSF